MEYQLDQLQQQMLEMQQHMANMTVALRDTRDRAQAAEDALAQQQAVQASAWGHRNYLTRVWCHAWHFQGFLRNIENHR